MDELKKMGTENSGKEIIAWKSINIYAHRMNDVRLAATLH